MMTQTVIHNYKNYHNNNLFCLEVKMRSVTGSLNSLFVVHRRRTAQGTLKREVRVASRGQAIVSVASQGDRFKCISCVPGFQPQAYELRPAVSKELHQLHRKIGVYKSPTIGKFLHSFIVLYFIHNYMHTYRIVE
jgi:hypothetical protein